MAMIASGSGWAVTTPTCFFRTRKFHKQIKLHPFPSKGFFCHLSLFATAECSSSVIHMIDKAMRSLIKMRLIQPAYGTMPWLENSLYLIPKN